MHPDAERWNARYARTDVQRGFEPDPVLCSLAALLPRTGPALELACGTAGNALWLAGLGLRVSALDVSVVALTLARGEARRRGVTLDLVVADALRLPFADAHFALVVVTRYLERSLFPVLCRSVRPGGIVFFRTFNQRHRIERPGFNPCFVLEDGELSRAFDGFTLLAGNEGACDGASSSHILVRNDPIAARIR